VRSLASKLGPLSPNGQIPGFHGSADVPGAPTDSEFDFDSWLNNTNEGADFNFDPASFDFDTEGGNAAGLPASSADDDPSLFEGAGGDDNLFPNGAGTSFTDFGASETGNGKYSVNENLSLTCLRTHSSS
jgi:hypothetical protein